MKSTSATTFANTTQKNHIRFGVLSVFLSHHSTVSNNAYELKVNIN